MNYNHLYYFYIAAKFGGVTAAAEKLHVSQPSLSSQLKVLQNALDLKLLIKVGRKNKLTPIGEIVYGYCRQMFELSDKMSLAVVKKAPFQRKRIQIGISNDVEKEFVSEVITKFLNQFPAESKPQVSLVSGGLKQLTERLSYKEVDTVITAQSIVQSDSIDTDEVSVPVVLCCPKNWNIDGSVVSRENQETINQLKSNEDIQWILPAGHFELRKQVDNFLSDNMIKVKTVFESDNFSSIIKSVQNDLGISFLPLFHVTDELKTEQLNYLGTSEGFWKYKLTIGTHQQNKNDPLVRAFSNSFKLFCAN